VQSPRNDSLHRCFNKIDAIINKAQKEEDSNKKFSQFKKGQQTELVDDESDDESESVDGEDN
jgi:hypothetical protein